MNTISNLKSIHFHGGILGGVKAKEARADAHRWVKKFSNYQTHKVVRMTSTFTAPGIGIITHRSYEVRLISAAK